MMTRNIPASAFAVLLTATGLVAQQTDQGAAGDPGVAGEAPQPQPLTPPPVQQMVTGAGNAWFDRTRLFMGDFLDKEKVNGKFSFKNPTGKPVRFMNLHGSCQCAMATIKVAGRTYELSKKPVADSLHKLVEKDGKIDRQLVTHINIGPDEAGEIEVQMEMGGIQGFKEANLQITTTDPDMKSVTLQWQAKGVKLFNVVPNDVFLNNMKWGDQRKFSFIVESDVNPDFKLLDHEKLPPYVKITKEQIKRPNGRSAWKIDGTFGPHADPKSGGASIKFKTDWGEKEVSLNVIATITGPVSIEPGTFLSFGKVRKGKGAEKEITIKPNGDFNLEMESVEFRDLTIDKKYLSATAEHKGKDLVVRLRIAPEAQGAFLLRGSMVVSFNHPALKEKKFNFNGILR